MSPDEKGRHCQQCNKVVYDFTRFTDDELMAFFVREQGVCGRFKSSQIGRDPHDRSSNNLKWAIAACSLMMLSQAELMAQNAVIATEDSVAAVDVFTQAPIVKVVRLSIHQADTQADRITRLRMTLGEFSIDSDIDSNNALSISIPAREVGTFADFELYNQLGDTIVILEARIGQGEINFSKVNGRWTALSNGLDFLIASDRPITSQTMLGFSIPIRLFEPEIVAPVFNHEPRQLFYLGDTVIVNHSDTSITDTLVSKGSDNNAKHAIRQTSDTGNSKVWWASIIGGIGLFLSWIWWRSRRE